MDATQPAETGKQRGATSTLAVGFLAALFLAASVGDHLDGRPVGWAFILVAALLALFVGMVKAERPWSAVPRYLWWWACFAGAFTAPFVVYHDVNSRPGALTAWETTRNVVVGAIAFGTMFLIGEVVRSPIRALKVAGWAVAISLVTWGVVSLYEAMTVKALLAAVVVLLLMKSR